MPTTALSNHFARLHPHNAPAFREMVHLIMGLPGVGKSTVARALRDRLNAVAISTDDVYDVVYGAPPAGEEREFEGERLETVYRVIPLVLTRLLCRYALRHVILDGTYRYERHRAAAIRASSAAGHRISIIQVKASIEQSRRRLMARTRAGSQETSVATLETAVEEYEMPTQSYDLSNDTDAPADLEERLEAYIRSLEVPVTDHVAPHPSPSLARDWITQMWALQDNLLQWYRAIFLAAQTLLSAAGAVLLQQGASENWIAVVILAIVGMLTTMVWIFVADIRGRNVHYWQWKLLQSERAEGPPATYGCFLEWQKRSREDQRAIYDSETWIGRRMDLTRAFFHVVLPICFLLIWIYLLSRAW